MRKGKSRWKQSLIIGILSLFSWNLSDSLSKAQMNIVADDTLGTENSIPEIRGDRTFIEGGASRGINLFHSFEAFNIDEGKAAYFTVGDTAIENIFSRITGSDPSDILGTLGTCISGDCPNTQPSAALYFINPNGIVFGRNASLDVGGSFVATTANAIEFEGGGAYGTSPGEIASDLLTVNPSAFLFNQSIAQPPNSIESRATLSIPKSRSLLLVGGRLNPDETSTGDIVIREGRLRSPGGQIAIGGLVNAGRIGLNNENNQLSLIFPDDVTRSDFRMTGEANGFAELDVTSGGGGDISVYARNIDILGGSDICAGIGSAFACGNVSTSLGNSDSQGGDILFDASETVTISDPFSVVINDVYPSVVGNSGDIVIRADSLNLINGGQLSANTSGQGNSGKIIIDVTDRVLLQEGDSDVFIYNEVNLDAIGRSGGIEITTGELKILGGAQVLSRVRGEGISGGVTIQAEEAIVLDGRENNDVSGFPSAIATGLEPDAEGQGGDISIVADSLSVTNRAQILNNTEGVGNAGDVNIKVEEDVLLNNSDIITEVTEGSGNGQGGNIQISANSLELRNGSSLLADTENIGNAGNIRIDVRGAVVLRGQGPGANDPNEILPSQISTTVESNARGRGGEINVSANSLTVMDDGFISSSTSGEGRAGNISVTADNISLQTGGELAARTFGARDGGNLSVNTGNLQITGGSLISTETSGAGNAGSLTVVAAETISLEGTTPDGSTRSNLNAVTNAGGRGGDLLLSVPSLSITDGAGIGVATFSSGNAGSLKIQNAELIEIVGSSNAETPSWLDAQTGEDSTGQGGSIEVESDALRIADEAIITARSFGTGAAGEITLNIADRLQLSDGGITTESLSSSGGNIIVGDDGAISGVLILEGDSDITTESLGDGGNITIRMPVVAFNDSDILARSQSANGGNITLSALFSDIIPFDETAPFDGDGKVDINAAGEVSEGNVDITDTSFLQNELAELPDNLANIDTLALSSCVARAQENGGTIVVSGVGNLRNQPSSAATTYYSTGNVDIVENPSATHLGQSNEAIVEPQAVYSLSDGRLVMSRPCL